MDHLPGSSPAQPTEHMMLSLLGNVPPAYRVNLNPRKNSEGPSNSRKTLLPLCLPIPLPQPAANTSKDMCWQLLQREKCKPFLTKGLDGVDPADMQVNATEVAQ